MTYEIGQKFRDRDLGGEYMLVACEPYKVVIVSLNGGGFLESAVKVSDVFHVSIKNVDRLMGEHNLEPLEGYIHGY